MSFYEDADRLEFLIQDVNQRLGEISFEIACVKESYNGEVPHTYYIKRTLVSSCYRSIAKA